MMFAAQRSGFMALTGLALLVMSLLAGSSAQAITANGAIHISDSNCHDDDGYLACMTAEGVANETLTPSGNAIYSGYVRATFVLTDPAGALMYQGASDSHFQRLDKDGLLHILSNRVSSTTTMPDGTTCIFTYATHLANGQIQFDHTAAECH